MEQEQDIIEGNKLVSELRYRCSFLETQINRLESENYELRKKITPEWWKDKKEGSLPMYVKTKNGKIWQVKYYTHGKYFYARLFNNVSSIPVKCLVPATKEEFLNQNK